VRTRTTLQIFLFSAVASLLLACGNSGESPTSSNALPAVVTVRGSIASESGNQSDMQGWIVVLVDKATEACIVSEVDAAGLYTLKGVTASKTYTLVLLSPTYVVSAVLSHPGLVTNTVRQYFAITAATLPRLIHKGPIVTLQSEVGVTIQKDAATDLNGDGIPDGIANVIGIELSGARMLTGGPLGGFALTAAPKSTTDYDKDGLRNVVDPDIDGDGLPNGFDSDDDGDGLYDIFDQDSDGDVIADSLQTDNDLYFPLGLEWLMTKFEMTPNDDDTFKSTLTFFAKVRGDGPLPSAVQVRGPIDLVTANIEAVSEDGSIIEQAWDKLLLDDGASEDAAADDLLFARKIVLPESKLPAFHQVTFVQLAYGSGDDQWFLEFPYTFAPVTPKAIKSTYQKFSGQISLTGNPFGDIQDFMWRANVYDAETGLKVYTTEAKFGTDRAVTLPTDRLEVGKTYQYDVTAQVLDRVPGYVAYSINSPRQDLETE
jgi:hypothetical protein